MYIAPFCMSGADVCIPQQTQRHRRESAATIETRKEKLEEAKRTPSERWRSARQGTLKKKSCMTEPGEK